MARSDCILLLDLHEFFADDRQRSMIHINQNYKEIKDLEERISEIFGIKEFHLLIDGHLLPSCEDIALLKGGNTVCVKPNIISSHSILLGEFYYTNNSNTCVEENIISNDEIATELVQECNEVEVSSKRIKVSKKKKVKHKIKKDHEKDSETLRENERLLYSSTPNNSNIHPVSADPDQNEEVIESNSLQSYKKKKRKRKSEIDDGEDNVIKLKKYKEGKCILLNEGTQSNKATNEEYKSEKTMTQLNVYSNNEGKGKIIHMNDEEKIINNKKCNHSEEILKFMGDEKLNNSNNLIDSVDLKIPKSIVEKNSHQKDQSETFAKKVESHITETNKLYSQPLPLKKAKDIKSWSTAPLSKTTNLVKIIKVPTVKIEIDYSRFLYIPEAVIEESNENTSDITSDTLKSLTLNEIKSQNISNISLLNVQQIDSNNPSQLLDINPQNCLDQNNTELIQFNNSSEIAQIELQQKCINPSDLDESLFASEKNDSNCREIKEKTKELMPNPHSTDKNPLFNSFQDDTCSNIGFDHLKLKENSQKIKTSAKSEARELWRQKINQKHIKNYEKSEKESLTSVNNLLNMDELCMNSSVKGSTIVSQVENKIEEQSNKINCSIKENMEEDVPVEINTKMTEFSAENSEGLNPDMVPDGEELLQSAVLKSGSEAKNRMIEQSNGIETSIDSVDDDLIFLKTTVEDGNFAEPKRRRRRRHKKKIIKDINTRKVENISHVKTSSWIPAKPKLHLRFNDSEDDIPVQSDVTNPGDEITEIGEKIKILGDVSIIPEVNSQGETEFIDYENKINVKSSIEDNDKNEITVEHNNTKKLPEIESLDNTLLKLKAELLKTIDTLKSDMMGQTVIKTLTDNIDAIIHQ